MFAALLAAAVLPGAIAADPSAALAARDHESRSSRSAAWCCGALRLDARSLRRALDLLLVPAAALALLAILQARGVFHPFAFSQGQAARYQLTSLAGSVGDLAAYLVLPALVLQAALLRARTVRGRVVAAIVLATLVYTIVVTQTLAALAAIVVASLVFWAMVVPWRRWWVAAVPLAVAGVAARVRPRARPSPLGQARRRFSPGGSTRC